MSNCVPERVKSTHKSEVVPVKLEAHPNADKLSVVRVFGYSCCVNTKDWEGIDRAVYIVPDSLVDVRRPEFSFLAADANGDGLARVKARRMRGVVSYGLLVPAPEGASLGDDLADRLGVTRYEPPEPGEGGKEKFLGGGEEEAGPCLQTGPNKYDVDAFERYHHVFKDGEPVVVTEKLDGSNARFVYWEGRYWVKTRKLWVKRVPDYSHVTLDYLLEKGVPEDKAKEIVERVALRRPQVNGFWQVLEKTPALMEYLRANPGTTVFGEIYGNTNRIKYGLPTGNEFAAFDVYRDGRFMGAQEMHVELRCAEVPVVPVPTKGFSMPYSFDAIKGLADGPSHVYPARRGTIREGVVVKPLNERWDETIGRVVLKCVSPDFLGMK